MRRRADANRPPRALPALTASRRNFLQSSPLKKAQGGLYLSVKNEKKKEKKEKEKKEKNKKKGGKKGIESKIR